MNARTLAGMRGRRRKRGLTVVGAIVLAAVLALLTALLLPLLAVRTVSTGHPRCHNRIRHLYKGIRLYLNNFDEFFPMAWHVGGDPLPDLGNVSYHRFAIYEHCDSTFDHVVQSGQTPAETTADKFEATRRFWQCTMRGRPTDYFAPDIVFRLPAADGQAQHPRYNDLVVHLSSTERPLLADVDASYAQDVGAFPDDEYKSAEHKRDVEQGWQITQCLGNDVFLGVGPSLRKPGEPASTRFDFRHNGRCNVLYLDSHVVAVGQKEHEKLKPIHDAWNALAPQAATARRKESP